MLNIFFFVISDENRIIKKGKISLEKVQEMVATHKLDPEKNTPTILAQYYTLDLGMKLNLALVQSRVSKGRSVPFTILMM